MGTLLDTWYWVSKGGMVTFSSHFFSFFFFFLSFFLLYRDGWFICGASRKRLVGLWGMIPVYSTIVRSAFAWGGW